MTTGSIAAANVRVGDRGLGVGRKEDFMTNPLCRLLENSQDTAGTVGGWEEG